MRPCYRWHVHVLVAVLTATSASLPLTAAHWAQASSAGARPTLGPAPGRLVDVGGFRLHLHCVGAGTPTVIFDAGAGSWSIHWTYVQRQMVMTGGTFCTYDRAGLGWSDASPAPRRTAQMVEELHRLLHGAGIAPPVILAGHSLGAWNVRAYQARYPEEVAGLVLVDGAHEAQWTRLPAVVWQLTKMSTSSTRATAERARRRELGAIDIGEADFLSRASDQRGAYVASMLDPRTYETIAEEVGRADESAADTPRSLAGSLGDLPIVVVTARDSFAAFAPIPQAEANTIWLDLQGELAALSRNTVRIFSEQGNHRLQESDPDAVVAAINRATDLVQQRPVPPAGLGVPAAMLPRTSTPAVDRLLTDLEATYRAKDVDGFVALFADTFAQLDVNRRVHVRGRDPWREWTKRINDAHTAMTRTHRGRAIVGDWVIVEVEWSGTLRPEAIEAAVPRAYRYTGLGLLRLRDGRIDAQILYGDFATFSEQLAGRPGQ